MQYLNFFVGDCHSNYSNLIPFTDMASFVNCFFKYPKLNEKQHRFSFSLFSSTSHKKLHKNQNILITLSDKYLLSMWREKKSWKPPGNRIKMSFYKALCEKSNQNVNSN